VSRGENASGPRSELHPRDRVLRDTPTLAEKSLFAMLMAAAGLLFFWADPRSTLALGILLVGGGLCPVLLRTHEFHHPFFVHHLWRRWALLAAPVWTVVGAFLLGLLQPVLTPIEAEGEQLIGLREAYLYFPVSTAADSAALPLLGMASIYLMAANLMLVPKSRAFFDLLFTWLSILVGLVVAAQYAMWGIEAFFGERLGIEPNSLRVFPYTGHWAAFAALWVFALAAMADLRGRDRPDRSYLRTGGFRYWLVAAALGASARWVEPDRPAVLLLGAFAAAMLGLACKLAAAKRFFPAALAGAGTLCGLAGGFGRLASAAPPVPGTSELRRSAVALFLDQPVFGWGFDAFQHLLPFYVVERLLDEHHLRAFSDILQIPAEIGIVGCAALVGAIGYAVGAYLVTGKFAYRFANALMLGPLFLAAFAAIDSPTMSPAVVLTFWMMLFSAARWTTLSRLDTEAIDPGPTLIAPPSMRRVPFHTPGKGKENG